MSDKEQRVREIAYFLWEEEGYPEGQADRHWLVAESMLEGEGGREESDSEPVDESIPSSSEASDATSTADAAPLSAGSSRRRRAAGG